MSFHMCFKQKVYLTQNWQGWWIKVWLACDADQLKVDFICSFVNHPLFWRRESFLFWEIVLVILEMNMSCMTRSFKGDTCLNLPVKTHSHWWYPKIYHIWLPMCLHAFTKRSFDQLTASSSSIIASLSCRLACSHFWWISGGTLHRPLGFFSQRRRSRFCLAPSVAGGGRSGGGATGPLLLGREEDTFGFGVLAGVGPETLGGGVSKAFILAVLPEDFVSASISFSMIFLFASRGTDHRESSWSYGKFK